MADSENIGYFTPNVKKSGYSTDQFFGIQEYELGGVQNKSDDNPLFAYPGNRIPNIYDAPGTKSPTSTLVQRGFIRGIFPEVMERASKLNSKYTNSAPPTRRCFFQFNPSLILRSVQASSSTLNPLLQSPTELLQPVPGQASFEFQLLFNREREVSNQEYLTNDGMTPVTTLNQSLAAYGESPSYTQSHVGDLGVLADLYVLDSIIGQSIAADTIQSIQNYWDITKNLRGASTTDGTGVGVVTTVNADGSTTTTETKADGKVIVTTTALDGTKTVKTSTKNNPVPDYSAGTFKDKIKQVLGNSAFLSPMPVRIVFSSLFMVEGFVTSSNVAFHKFSKNMIPTVCSVTLNVQALYIGFAKKDSFVSAQLEQQLVQSIKETQITEKNHKAALDFLKSHVFVRIGGINPYVKNTNTAGDTLNATTAIAINYNYEMRLKSTNIATVIKNGLAIWTNTSLLKTSPVQDINVTDISLIFVDKANISKDLDSAAKLKKAAEAGTLNPGYTNLSVAAANNNELISNNVITKVNIFNNKDGDKLDIASADVIKSNWNSPYTTEWESSTISLMAATIGDADKTKFFGNNCSIVLTVTLSCTYKDAVGDILNTDSITRAAVLTSFDPNSTTQYTRLKQSPDVTNAITIQLTDDLAGAKNTTGTNSGKGKTTKPKTKTTRLPNGRIIVTDIL